MLIIYVLHVQFSKNRRDPHIVFYRLSAPNMLDKFLVI